MAGRGEAIRGGCIRKCLRACQWQESYGAESDQGYDATDSERDREGHSFRRGDCRDEA